jgi:hypothetical protein
MLRLTPRRRAARAAGAAGLGEEATVHVQIVTFQSEGMDAYTRSDLFAAVTGHPNFVHVTSSEFGVLDGRWA